MSTGRIKPASALIRISSMTLTTITITTMAIVIAMIMDMDTPMRTVILMA
jgi:hypothetical protein